MPVPHVLVVLGHRLEGQDDRPSKILLDRLSYAARFFRLHAGGAKEPFRLVVLSGGMTRPGQRLSEAEVMKAWLPRGIIPADLLVCETESRNTIENIRNAIRSAEERFPEQPIAFLFVTQSWHYPQVALHFMACAGGDRHIAHFLVHPPVPVPGELPLAESLLRFLVLVYTWADPAHRLLGWARRRALRIRPYRQSTETAG